MKVGSEVTMSPEDLERWTELEGNTIKIWAKEPPYVYISVNGEKDYQGWDEDWFEEKAGHDPKCLRPSNCTAEENIGVWCKSCKWLGEREDK